MNITSFTIYLWQIADKIVPIALALAILSTILTAVILIMHAIAIHSKGYYSDNEYYKKELAGAEAMNAMTSKRWKKALGTTLVLWAVASLIPSSNTIAMMVVIPKIAESKVIQQDLPDIYNAAVDALKASLKK